MTDDIRDEMVNNPQEEDITAEMKRMKFWNMSKRKK